MGQQMMLPEQEQNITITNISGRERNREEREGEKERKFGKFNVRRTHSSLIYIFDEEIKYKNKQCRKREDHTIDRLDSFTNIHPKKNVFMVEKRKNKDDRAIVATIAT